MITSAGVSMLILPRHSPTFFDSQAEKLKFLLNQAFKRLLKRNNKASYRRQVPSRLIDAVMIDIANDLIPRKNYIKAISQKLDFTNTPPRPMRISRYDAASRLFADRSLRLGCNVIRAIEGPNSRIPINTHEILIDKTAEYAAIVAVESFLLDWKSANETFNMNAEDALNDPSKISCMISSNLLAAMISEFPNLQSGIGKMYVWEIDNFLDWLIPQGQAGLPANVDRAGLTLSELGHSLKTAVKNPNDKIGTWLRPAEKRLIRFLYESRSWAIKNSDAVAHYLALQEHLEAKRNKKIIRPLY